MGAPLVFGGLADPFAGGLTMPVWKGTRSLPPSTHRGLADLLELIMEDKARGIFPADPMVSSPPSACGQRSSVHGARVVSRFGADQSP
jgi:hypothetical protein